MATRSWRDTVVFKHDFRIRGVDRALAPGSYEIVTDEEEIEGLSFLAFRRIATYLRAADYSRTGVRTESFDIDPNDLKEALRMDALM